MENKAARKSFAVRRASLELVPQMRGPFLLAAIAGLIALAVCAGCGRADNVTPAWDAQVRVNLAYAAKTDQCKQAPAFFLFVPFDVQEPDVRLCENELLSAACPLNQLPLSCAILFFKKAPKPDLDNR